MCQISRQLDIAFAFYSGFCKCAKRGRKIRRKNMKKLSHFLKSHISGTLEVISLKFGMWSTEVGWSVHSKHHLVSSRKHRATEVQKLHFFLPVNIFTGVARRLLGPHDILPCVLISLKPIMVPPQKLNQTYVTGFAKRYLFHTQNLTHFLNFKAS